MTPDSQPAPDLRPASIAVVLALFRPDPIRLRRSILSVLQQTAEGWDLVVTAAPKQAPEVEAVLDWAMRRPSIQVRRTDPAAGPSEALTLALTELSADWAAFLEQDVVLEPHAIGVVLAAAERWPGASVVYADSDTWDATGAVVDRFDRPDWSPQRLRGHNYIDGFVAVSAQAIRGVGGLRTGYDGAHLHDLLLRVTERGGPVVHVPRVLHHRSLPGRVPRPDAPGVLEARRRAVAEHLDRVGLTGIVRPAGRPEFLLTELSPRPTLLSVVIPTRGGTALVRGQPEVLVARAVRSIVAHSYTCDYEILVVHDTDADRGYLTQLAQIAGARLRVVDYDPPFNFSAKINAGAGAARGDVLVLLNDDVEVITPHWLDHLAALAQEPDVGAVGALLLFEDGTVQHAGQVVGDGHVRHIGSHRPHSGGADGANLIDREVTGVTAAVLAQRREVWSHVGGMDESLPNNFNDVDYCLRIAAKGYRIVQANSVQLYHFESRTRRRGASATEVRRLRERWGPQLVRDRYTTSDDDLAGDSERSLNELLRLSLAVLREEGARSWARKARGRVGRVR